MAYADPTTRPSLVFGVIVINDRTRELYVRPGVRAHDAAHAGRLACEYIRKTLAPERSRCRAWKVFRGRLKEAVQ